MVRIGIVTAAYPDTSKYALSLGADFYFPISLDVFNPWLLSQLDAGYLLPLELQKRGKELAMPQISIRREGEV